MIVMFQQKKSMGEGWGHIENHMAIFEVSHCYKCDFLIEIVLIISLKHNISAVYAEILELNKPYLIFFLFIGPNMGVCGSTPFY